MLRSSISLLLLSLLARPALAADPISYSGDIRPILAAACFQCHGQDEQARKAELRLDQQAQAHARRDDSSAIVPGSPARSLLMQRVTATDESARMPPIDQARQLSPDEIDLLERWIRQGGDYESHWAFDSPSRPQLPSVENQHWPRNAVDYFVLARLEQEQLTPSQPANRNTLIRRLYHDLVGLPPTPAAVQSFAKDRRPDAYESLVEQLLASPRFGERVAVEWLDAARYADTHGYHEDYHRDMWPWRDWVLTAINSNMPFDQFTVEQLAGDLLPAATSQQVVATGFNRNHGVTASGISEEYRVEYVLDRVRTTSTVWLGLTMECGQCHDHKYDPIPQRDFYRFFAYFNNITDRGVENKAGNVDPLAPVQTPSLDRQLQAIEKGLAAIDQQLRDYSSNADSLVAAWEQKQTASDGEQPLPEGLLLQLALDADEGAEVVDAVTAKPVGAIAGTVSRVPGKFGGAVELDGKSYLDLGDRLSFERSDPFSYGAWIFRMGGSGAIIARMDDANNYRGWDVFLAGGHVEFHMIHQWPANAIHAKSTKPVPDKQWVHLFVTYDGSSKASGFRLYMNGAVQDVNVTQDGLSGTIQTDKPLHIGRRNPSGFFSGQIDDVRVYSSALSPAAVATLAGSNPIAAILKVPAESRTAAQRQAVKQYYLDNVDPVSRQLLKQKAAGKQQQVDLKKAAAKLTVMVMQEMKDRRPTFILKRGQYDQHGEQVEAGTPRFLHGQADEARQDRLGLATWIVDPANPLTSRVTVNRFWQMIFGTGLVVSAEDFGTQGQLPSHPRLLDWLAVEFIESGWDIKQMMRLLVTSATYRQASEISADALGRDPENRLLARGSRYRMSAEVIRDNALAVSGLLVGDIGGPSVKPYQPAGLWKETSNRPYLPDKGSKLYRRSLYTYWKRSVPPPNMFAIDAPTRELCTVRRQRTNTPLAALVLMNDPVYVEAARHLAQRALEAHADDMQAAMADMFFRTTSRAPVEQETRILDEVFAEQLDIIREQPDRARLLLAYGDSPRNESLDSSIHATLTMIANMLLNMDEVISRE
jgi:hypothetical protein